MIFFALLFSAAGITHFVAPSFFVAIMPPPLAPWALELTFVSGFFELLGGVGLLFSRTRRLAAFGLMALLVAVYPANIFMVLEPSRFAVPVWVLWLRLPLQFLMLWGLWRIASVKKV